MTSFFPPIMEQPNEIVGVEGPSVYEEPSRSCRTKRKQKEPSCCPVCSVTLRCSEFDTHVVSEIDRLSKISSSKHKPNGKNTPSASTVNGSNKNSNKHWETYQKVKSNRQGRQRVKSRKRRLEEIVCPVCNMETNDDITLHVEMCLRRSENSTADSDENIDVEGGFDEYEWAGQSRVRATSLLQGGLSALGVPLTSTDEDEDLVVDGDDAPVYGAAQYSERDIIIPGDDKEQEALRKAILGSESVKSSKGAPSKTETVSVSGDPTIEALKCQIRELQRREQVWDDTYKCLICMERYKTPVISICCWHVHCELCWLQTLGAKKLCPQCNMITSPADLRRIYM